MNITIQEGLKDIITPECAAVADEVVTAYNKNHQTIKYIQIAAILASDNPDISEDDYQIIECSTVVCINEDKDALDILISGVIQIDYKDIIVKTHFFFTDLCKTCLHRNYTLDELYNCMNIEKTAI